MRQPHFQLSHTYVYPAAHVGLSVFFFNSFRRNFLKRETHPQILTCQLPFVNLLYDKIAQHHFSVPWRLKPILAFKTDLSSLPLLMYKIILLTIFSRTSIYVVRPRPSSSPVSCLKAKTRLTSTLI